MVSHNRCGHTISSETVGVLGRNASSRPSPLSPPRTGACDKWSLFWYTEQVQTLRLGEQETEAISKPLLLELSNFKLHPSLNCRKPHLDQLQVDQMIIHVFCRFTFPLPFVCHCLLSPRHSLLLSPWLWVFSSQPHILHFFCPGPLCLVLFK